MAIVNKCKNSGTAMKLDKGLKLCILLEPAFSELDYDNKWVPEVKRHVDMDAFNCYFVGGGGSIKDVLPPTIKGQVYSVPFPFSSIEGVTFLLSYFVYFWESFILLLWLVRKHRIQVLVSLGGHLYTGFIVSLVSKLMHAKSIVREAEMSREEIKLTRKGGHFISAAFRPIEKYVYSCCDAIITNRSAGEIIRKGVKREKVHLVSQGIQFSLFDTKVQPKILHSGFPRVISVSRLSKEKNLISAIRAMKIVKARYPDCVLEIIGAGREFERLSREIQLLGLDSNVFLEGRVPYGDIPALLKGCDIFVLASIYEGLPCAMLEAMACELPVIATPVMEDIVNLENNVNILFTVPTPTGIAQAIIRISDDTHLRERIRRNGYLFVKKRHDSVMAKALFTDVVNGLR